MEEEEYETLYVESYQPSRRFMKVDLLMLGLDLARGIAAAVTDTLESAQALTAAHANWQVDRDLFHEEAALEIETLTSGDDD